MGRYLTEPTVEEGEPVRPGPIWGFRKESPRLNEDSRVSFTAKRKNWVAYWLVLGMWQS